MRTADTGYGLDYWQSLDSGRGYQDSVMWEDIAHITKELFAIRDGRDASGDTHLVDVGCAMGYLVKHLRRRGVDAWGIDFARYALNNADPFALPWLRLFDLTSPQLTFLDGSCGPFNYLTSFETLEHIPVEHTDQAAQHLWDLLDPGGEALLTICVEGQPGWDTDPTHVNVVSRDFWDGLFERRGWQILDEKRRYLQQFWLFSAHRGVWVLKKPSEV